MSRRKVRPRRAMPGPRPIGVGWVVLSAALALTLAFGSHQAYGMWSAGAATSKLTLQQATVGLAATKGEQKAVSSNGGAATLTIGKAEAQELVGDGPDGAGRWGVAVPFEVTLLASGGYGLDYSLALGSPGSGTVFGLPGAQRVIFPLGGNVSCTVADARSAAPYAGGPVTGIAPGASTAQTVTDQWCLAVLVSDPTYTNVATASGTTPAGGTAYSQPDQDSTWWAYVIPDPGAEPDVRLAITPQVVNPA